MRRLLLFGLWTSAALGVIAIVFIVGYTARNSSGHTGWEPFTSFILFVPLVVTGAICLRQRFAGLARPGVCALVVGLAGVALVITLDRTNRLVQYERWIHRGHPAP